MTEADLAPVVRTRRVHCTPEHAFRVFTERIGAWWPVRGHSLGGAARVTEVALECRAGGRLRELWNDGTEHVWGEITVWEPPGRLVLVWRPAPTDEETEIEVTFAASGDGTLVTLIHRGWDRLKVEPGVRRSSYEAGWPRVLAHFADRATDPACVEAHARIANQIAWAFLEEPERTPDDDARMLSAAHASAFHWERVGGPAERARAEWLLSRVYAVLGSAERATVHAERCAAACEAGGVDDFDRAYAAEARARAAAAAGDPAQARSHRARAVALAARIADDEDRGIFAADLAAEPWFGVAETDPGGTDPSPVS